MESQRSHGRKAGPVVPPSGYVAYPLHAGLVTVARTSSACRGRLQPSIPARRRTLRTAQCAPTRVSA